MTIAELERLIEAKKKIKLREDKERASFDYRLGELIGRSIARIYSSSAKYPAIEEAYPSLFNSEELEEEKEKRLAELSALRFRQFADAFNKKQKNNKEVDKIND
jgi:hypothetical protein